MHSICLLCFLKNISVADVSAKGSLGLKNAHRGSKWLFGAHSPAKLLKFKRAHWGSLRLTMAHLDSLYVAHYGSLKSFPREINRKYPWFLFSISLLRSYFIYFRIMKKKLISNWEISRIDVGWNCCYVMGIRSWGVLVPYYTPAQWCIWADSRKGEFEKQLKKIC